MNVETEPLESVIQRQLRAELDRERGGAAQGMEADLAMARETVKALALSENYFRHLTEYSLDLITILDPLDGTIRFESRSIVEGTRL